MENRATKAIERLPKNFLDRASLRGNEYAWRASDIPEVIEAAMRAGMINLGGQLQFRLPHGGTCECYWVGVDTYQSVPKGLSWPERVKRTAEIALADFAGLSSKFDFLTEGRRAFHELEKNDSDLADAMCFVWYVIDAEESAELER